MAEIEEAGNDPIRKVTIPNLDKLLQVAEEAPDVGTPEGAVLSNYEQTARGVEESATAVVELALAVKEEAMKLAALIRERGRKQSDDIRAATAMVKGMAEKFREASGIINGGKS